MFMCLEGGGNRFYQNMPLFPYCTETVSSPTDHPDVATLHALNRSVSLHSAYTVQRWTKRRRIGCVVPHCNLQRGITQPILWLFFDISVHGSFLTSGATDVASRGEGHQFFSVFHSLFNFHMQDHNRIHWHELREDNKTYMGRTRTPLSTYLNSI